MLLIDRLLANIVGYEMLGRLYLYSLRFVLSFTIMNSWLFSLSQVRRGWLKDPESIGEVAVRGLSAGEHHFACSVGDHCLRGMRMRVNVESRTAQENDQNIEVCRDMCRRGCLLFDMSSVVQVSTDVVHTVRWLIRQYEDMTITEGEAITFAWDGFHSLHQVAMELQLHT